MPGLLVNCPVHSVEGRLLGIADLLDLQAGLVIEYDGADHRSIKRHTADVGKDDRFASRGLEVTRVTGTDLHQPGRVIARVLRARERALYEPVEQRRWVPRPPVDDLDTRLDDREAFAIQQEWWDEQDAQWAG